MEALLLEEVRIAADRYEDWQHTGNVCGECQDYVGCPCCSVLFEYEVAMMPIMAALATMQGFCEQSTFALMAAADFMVDANWIIRYGERWGESL